MDETHISRAGTLVLPVSAIDSAGATIDFLLSALRDTEAVKRLFRTALGLRLIRSRASQYGSGNDLRFGHF